MTPKQALEHAETELVGKLERYHRAGMWVFTIPDGAGGRKKQGPYERRRAIVERTDAVTAQACITVALARGARPAAAAAAAQDAIDMIRIYSVQRGRAIERSCERFERQGATT